MKREDLLQEMKESVGTKDPLVFFTKMVDVFNLMFDQMEALEKKLHRVKIQSALAIQWEPKVARELLASQVIVLRKDKDTYAKEISTLKQAYAEDMITQSYQEFCVFWEDTLGWHPFLD